MVVLAFQLYIIYKVDYMFIYIILTMLCYFSFQL